MLPFKAPSRLAIRRALTGPSALAFIPAISLGSFWIGGEALLLGVALILPALISILRTEPSATKDFPRDGLTGLMLRDGLENLLDINLNIARETGKNTAALVMQLDDFDEFTDRHGHKASDDIRKQVGLRLKDSMRDIDEVARLNRGAYAVAVAPSPRMDLEAMIQISGRLQKTISEPYLIDNSTVYLTGSVGFCLGNRSPEPNGPALLDAAELALKDAQHNGHGAIRAFSSDMQVKAKAHHALTEDVVTALENGEIRPWFQPQVSTDTGKVTGFEALARWYHPKRGMISPMDFLPAVEQADQFERLSEVMLYQSMVALKKWEGLGFVVPQIGVNFASDELRNPKLVDKIRWELDRFDLAPERLAVEILETVVEDTKNDIITRNIAGLAQLGCSIDLDDFGTGHASISNIRRFAVGRIKIDRSFVIKVDKDSDQQRMVSAVITMAEQLGLGTLAEGVETAGEHAMLAQLGCGHVQGYGLGRPMPFEDTLEWMRQHNAKLGKSPVIGRHAG